jgi:hypothetical protein
MATRADADGKTRQRDRIGAHAAAPRMARTGVREA